MPPPLLLRSPSSTADNTPTPNPIIIKPEPLTPESFSPFGVVTSFPLAESLQSRTLPIPSLDFPRLPSDHPTFQPSYVHANQGTALKFVNAAPLQDLYDNAPSSGPSVDGTDVGAEPGPRSRPDSGRGAVSMFSCFPRPPSSFRRSRSQPPSSTGTSSSSSSTDNSTTDNITLPLTVLERHPYTTQSFIPLGLSRDNDSAAFLVVVAPTLHATEAPALITASSSSSSTQIPSPPSIPQTRAFLARGDQAVTYHPATWHAPMIVLGRERIDFMVVQHVSGVAEEDCQEVSLAADPAVSLEESGLETWDVQVDLSSLAELGFHLPLQMPVADTATKPVEIKNPGLSSEAMERKWQEQRSNTPERQIKL